MYPKHKILNIIKELSPIFIKAFKLKGEVNFIICKSNSKERKQYTPVDDVLAYFFPIPSGCNILIFYDKCTGYDDCICSMYHELLHAFLYKYRNKVLTHTRDENIIRVLERVYKQTYKKVNNLRERYLYE